MALADTLKEQLGTLEAWKVKSQGFHWNVEGDNFVQLHELFGNIYEEADDAIDTLAEHIRTLEVYAPGSMKRFIELSAINEQDKIPNAKLMVKELINDSEIILGHLDKCFAEATKDNKQGIANFIADRQAAHSKFLWMLKSFAK
jgi:starvation-inducible DNA-binding protein